MVDLLLQSKPFVSARMVAKQYLAPRSIISVAAYKVSQVFRVLGLWVATWFMAYG